ncbi:MAG TPA: alkaline phosphatase [Solirubrobacterales bacterium]|nr:alkaline phosphatase [Solirubrobacterales bacterium]
MRAKRRYLGLFAALALVAIAAASAVAGAHQGWNDDGDDNSREIKRLIDSDKPENVILLIGDGMGDSEITLARYYGKGAEGTLNMETLPFAGELITYGLSAGPGPTYPPNYVPDSAPTATAWSTGKKTIDARLSQGPSSAENVPGSNAGFKTTFEYADKRGMRVGNVSTAEITDATPAAPSSHISQRACQGPNDTRNLCPSEAKGAKGLGSIAEQQVDHLLDVNLGGGRNRYLQTLDGSTDTVIDYAQDKGYRYVQSAIELDGITSLSNGPVLGLFTPSNMTTEFKPLVAAPTPGAGSPDFRCDETNRPANEPSLAAMTDKAIDLLENRKGFFLQVEGASIDKRDHASDVCGQIGENLAFDEAVGVALEYQEDHEDTLVVITADHSHTSQIVPAAQDTPGFYATLKTADGFPIRVSYATGKTPGGQTHTGARVPVAAIGPQATNIMGVNDQTDLFQTLIGHDD